MRLPSVLVLVCQYACLIVCLCLPTNVLVCQCACLPASVLASVLVCLAGSTLANFPPLISTCHSAQRISHIIDIAYYWYHISTGACCFKQKEGVRA